MTSPSPAARAGVEATRAAVPVVPLTDYERGVLDGLSQALKALDGHGFHDTAHARVRRLMAPDCFCGNPGDWERVHRSHACERWSTTPGGAG